MLTAEELREWGRDNLPGLIGFEVIEAEPGHLRARLTIRPALLAPNGYLHGGSVVAMADSACGFGTMIDLPEGAQGFTTIELKTNFLRTCVEGGLICDAKRLHSGRSTQVWDATVAAEDTGKPIALFRCTQMLLYTRA